MYKVLKLQGDDSTHEQPSTHQLGLNSDGPGVGLCHGTASQITNPALSTSSFCFTFY